MLARVAPMPHLIARRSFRLLALALTGAALAACGGGSDVRVTTAVPTAAASSTPTPAPTPVPLPKPSDVALPQGIDNTTGGALTQAHTAVPAPPPKDMSSVKASESGIMKITSPKLGLDNYIEDVGITNGEMDTPNDAVYAVGWYKTYDRPGAKGNVMLSAHETWNHQQGPFYKLYGAAIGDDVTLNLAGGKQYRYKVISNQRFDVKTIPMAEIIWPSRRPANAEWITLLTCGGRIVYDASGFGEYLDRDVIIAQRVD